MKHLNSLMTLCLLFLALGLYAQPEAGMPSEPGKCYAKCLIADQYETVTEQVLVKEASSKVQISPATYETVSEQILAKAAGNSLSVTPATFETVSEQKLAQEASTTLSTVPAKFETMSERKLSKEAPRALLQNCTSTGNYASGDAAVASAIASNMGEVGTLSVSPAQLEGSSEQILVQEAFTQLRVVPATFETITEQKLVRPAYHTLRVVPAVYETISEQVLDKEAYNVLSVVPAVYETETEQILSKEAYSTISTSPSTYETITEQKLAHEAGTRIERVPAQFETANETIQTAAASTKWVKKKADRNCLSANPDDCLVWCLVEVPAQFRTVTKQVRKACDAGWTASGDDCIRTIDVPAQQTTISYQKLVNPAVSANTDIPAVYTTRTFRKLVSPARTETRQVPATYKTYSYQKVVTPAHTVSVEVPAQYETVSHQKLASAATTTVIEVAATYRDRRFQTLSSDACANLRPCGNSTVLENVNFQTNSAVLTGSSMSEIRSLAAQLKGSTGTATLVGHTDAEGDDASNLDLSKRRAKAVYDALVAEGVDAGKLTHEGRGETSPIASNTTDSGRAQNRRTEMVTEGSSGQTDCNTYTNISYQQLTSDAQAQSADVPASYETVSFQKLSSAAATSSTDIPAQYTTRSYQKLANAASTSVTETPAQYNTVSKTNLVKAGGFTEWREVVCGSDITPAFYRKVQQALNDKGYDVGTVDGVIGAGTKAQLVKFQRDNNLPIGALDIETLKALGVNR